MPYIPRSIAPSGMIDPATVPRAPLRSVAAKPPVAYAGGDKSKVDSTAKSDSGRRKMLNRLSMTDWDIDPVKVYKQLTDKELDIDEHSRMVSTRRNSAQ
jgi:hypothetical protein